MTTFCQEVPKIETGLDCARDHMIPRRSVSDVSRARGAFSAGPGGLNDGH
jgi:hypothetical protein